MHFGCIENEMCIEDLLENAMCIRGCARALEDGIYIERENERESEICILDVLRMRCVLRMY